MGTTIPDEFPEIDDTKTYKVTVDAFQDAGPETDCNQNFVAQVTCCKAGNLLNNFIDNDFACTAGVELCVVSGFTAQRIKAIVGPYDTWQECIDDL